VLMGVFCCCRCHVRKPSCLEGVGWGFGGLNTEVGGRPLCNTDDGPQWIGFCGSMVSRPGFFFDASAELLRMYRPIPRANLRSHGRLQALDQLVAVRLLQSVLGGWIVLPQQSSDVTTNLIRLNRLW